MALLAGGADALGIHLGQIHLDKFELYYRELVRWNDIVNLTRITEYDEVQQKHFLDSLSVVLAWQPEDRQTVIDVGTGAGFPGIPLKIAYPAIKLTLLEATGKKVDFLNHIVASLALQDVEVLYGRAEEVSHDPSHREKYDIALSRAVADLPVLVELALPFCRPGGCFIGLKKGDIDKEIEKSRKAIDVLGGKLGEVRDIHLPGIPEKRYLVRIDKLYLTPDKYPRRPGIPAKRPLL